ncbi:CRE-NHR-145 protein [Caenorhabditis remanei]|uniref:CRE-NHR-145 protein n=1 Tax=Caenorhabditis remanei TaxID=31234 RepID=E3NDM1_CAERE|nr:CRE-NHR-145 protein [Caenorhabditis remanei]
MNPERQCEICAKPSNGMHFGAMTCRACAAFFRRAVVLKLQYTCKERNMCQLEGNGRLICRWCRFEKCKEIGMDPEKVVLDYDPTASQKVPTMSKMDSKILEEKSSEPEKSKEKVKVIKIDFSELVEKIEEIFETKKETSEGEEDDLGLSDSVYLNDLQNLTKGLQEFRAPIWSKGEIQQLGNADMKKVFIWLNVRIRKYATWFSHATYLMEKLPMDQKFQLYRTSWNVMRMFERIAMTWKHYGNEMFEGNFILVSDDTVMMVDKSLVHIEEISELTDDYFQKLFSPFLNKYIEEVARPLSELNLTEEEVVFCMVHILGFDVTDLAPETLEILHKFKEIISDQMHNYYMNSTNFKVYSHRIIKLMKLVNSMTTIARKKAKIKEVIWIFDIYKAEISDPYFFQMF